jgi:hypothetical protein
LIEENVYRHSLKELVFVHVRRGDYLAWPSREFPAVLILDWYLSAMRQMRAMVKNLSFIIASDDHYYTADCFSDISDVAVSRCGRFTDLALMSKCSHGILSTSSFAWWGALLSRSHRSSEARPDGNGVYFAPKYWAGH